MHVYMSIFRFHSVSTEDAKKLKFYPPEIALHKNLRATWQTALNHLLLSPLFFYNMTPVECFNKPGQPTPFPRHTFKKTCASAVSLVAHLLLGQNRPQVSVTYSSTQTLLWQEAFMPNKLRQSHKPTQAQWARLFNKTARGGTEYMNTVYTTISSGPLI